MKKLFKKIKTWKNHIYFLLYKDYMSAIYDIYTNYDQVLNIMAKYDNNDIFRETRIFLYRLSIEERMNDLNYYCGYDNNNDIINDAPLFITARNNKSLKRVTRAKTYNWLKKLLNDIIEYQNELIIRLNIVIDDFEG